MSNNSIDVSHSPFLVNKFLLLHCCDAECLHRKVIWKRGLSPDRIVGHDGKVKIANTLCRAGLHLGATIVGRMPKEEPSPFPMGEVQLSAHAVTAERSNHVRWPDAR